MRPALIRLSTPTALLSREEAKAQIVVEHAHDDDLIDGLIAAADSLLDGADGILGRALISQRWRAVWPGPPLATRIALNPPRLISVEAIGHVDVSGTSQIIDPASYRVFTFGDFGGVELAAGVDWPTVQTGRAGAFHIDFTAGYGADAAAVPGAIRAAAKLIVGHLYRHREASTSLQISELPLGVRHLIAPFRVPEGLF